ncbi:MAG: DEAD/DEAH box helicase family protein [Bacilli bacterium]|nr:DEAD/DEAH box helicase family protein [Bacilli bacterium]
MEKKAVIKIDEQAINIDNQKSNLSFDRRPFTKTIVEMGKCANLLDLYDDFDNLKIDKSLYKQKEGAEYGIPFDSEIHNAFIGLEEAVILPHQSKAASRFLKELRGFGLLADVVGSGKTFEAGLVLSELAARGRARSVLVVAPDQVYDTWISTLEMKFGLGKDAFLRADANFLDFSTIKPYLKESNGFTYISRPVIVKMEDFVNWNKNAEIKRLLFDVIVVDEAHNLCLKDHSKVNGLQMLSSFMTVKKKAGYPYCLLLSATPHNGDLSDMFRLWYFIRFKGGRPSDFSDNDSGASPEYLEEKRHYLSDVCYGATTVMEFIQKVRLKKIEAMYHDRIREDYPDFEKMSEARKIVAAEDFSMSDSLNENEKSLIEKAIANAYHNEVLRPIMIRQPNHLPKKKTVVNIFYYPTPSDTPSEVKISLFGETLIAKTDMLGDSVQFLKTLNENEGDLSPVDYCRLTGAPVSCSDILFQIIGKVSNAQSDSAFPVSGSKGYYKNQIARCERNENPFLKNYFSFTCGKNVNELKVEKAKEIIKENPDKKILVFFDYELSVRESCKEYLKNSLMEDETISKRLVEYIPNNKDKTIAKFNAKKGAVLLVEDAALTEGSNLQESSIIINFETTTDPLSMEQRIGRIFRLGQKHDVVIYSLADMARLEGFVLMYYAAIGLLNSNSGDASIIAGSNNDKMIPLKCGSCGNVKIVSQALFDEKSDDVYCSRTIKCRQENPKGTLMSEISNYNFECDQCHLVLQRDFNDDEAGTYRCVSSSVDGGKGKVCSSGAYGDRTFFCNSTCALSNCLQLRKIKCPLVEAIHRGETSDTPLFNICFRCNKREECERLASFGGEPCAYYRKGFSLDNNGSTDSASAKKRQIRKCARCEFAGCRPKPYVLEFNSEWVAKCPDPNCHGKLKRVNAGTFNTYVKSLWRFSTKNANDSSVFVDDLSRESKRVSEIKKILDMDEEADE